MDQQKRMYIVLAVAIALIIGGIVVLVLSASSEDPLYTEDTQTGREFYSDPGQAPEEVPLEVVSLLKSADIQQYFYDNYLLDLRADISDYLWKNVSEDIGIAYVDGEVTYTEERDVVFPIIVDDPVEARFTVTARITVTDKVETTIAPLE